jgi:NADPH:quinone reductase-like Zn-dependent oxidoreductase
VKVCNSQESWLALICKAAPADRRIKYHKAKWKNFSLSFPTLQSSRSAALVFRLHQMSTNVLVLGATGFIGLGVAAALRRAGYRVHGLVRSPAKVNHPFSLVSSRVRGLLVCLFFLCRGQETMGLT